MNRWHREWAVMARRSRQARGFGREPKGRGQFRKLSPFGGCAPSCHCGMCEAERTGIRAENRRARYAGRTEARTPQ